MLRFKCYGLRFEWLKLKFNSGFYPREGRYAVVRARVRVRVRVTDQISSDQPRSVQISPDQHRSA